MVCSQRCARQGGVWDESYVASSTPMAGACISKGQAQVLVASHPTLIESLEVTLSSDGALNAFEGGLPGNETTIRCCTEQEHGKTA